MEEGGEGEGGGGGGGALFARAVRGGHCWGWGGCLVGHCGGEGGGVGEAAVLATRVVVLLLLFLQGECQGVVRSRRDARRPDGSRTLPGLGPRRTPGGEGEGGGGDAVPRFRRACPLPPP